MVIDSTVKTLQTARLRLLPVHESLAAGAAAFYQRNAAHLAPWDPPSPPDFATEAFQRERLAKALADVAVGALLRWWLQPQGDTSRLVGSIGLSQIARGPFQNAMLGYAVDADCQGQGLMREALQAVIAHAFSPAVHLHRIQANVRPENARSVALLQRLGFEDEGLAREYLFIDGAWRDHRMFALRNRAFMGVPL
ncbi:MAG: GNAT family N-acetyltransferase [Betaproteobacteria bacterium]|jgi:ribosomal-protein-alanine N-acetyltransferase